MLIIAIPKSASTSLLHTLGEIHELKAQQDFASVKKNEIPDVFKIIGKYHSDCRELTPQNVKKWERSNQFYKQHIPPTKNNMQLLRDSRKIILLREPEDIVLAYRRADNKGLHETRAEFKGCSSEEDWLRKAKEIGFYQELNRFYKGWQYSLTDKCIIHFEDLISSEKEVVKTVSEYFDLPASEALLNNLKLKKFRYSRHNIVQQYVHKFVRRLRIFFKA